jgi:hypothetical protein
VVRKLIWVYVKVHSINAIDPAPHWSGRCEGVMVNRIGEVHACGCRLAVDWLWTGCSCRVIWYMFDFCF